MSPLALWLSNKIKKNSKVLLVGKTLKTFKKTEMVLDVPEGVVIE